MLGKNLAEHRKVAVMSTLGTPLDITLAELAIEMFFPADAATEESLRSGAKQRTVRDK